MADMKYYCNFGGTCGAIFENEKDLKEHKLALQHTRNYKRKVPEVIIKKEKPTKIQKISEQINLVLLLLIWICFKSLTQKSMSISPTFRNGSVEQSIIQPKQDKLL
jgi:hypothetical protein